MNKTIHLTIFIIAILLSQNITFVNAQTNGQKGALFGGTAGAVIGGVIGNQNDRTAKGAVIGGLAGAVAGGLMGNERDKELQRQYEYHQMQDAQHAYQMSRAVSINDVISMSNSGLSPQVMIGQVRSNGVQQEIGVSEIIMLHQAGVAESVIQEMQRARIGAPASVPAGRPSTVYVRPQPTVIVEPAPVYYQPIPVYGYYHPPHRHYRGHYYGFHW